MSGSDAPRHDALVIIPTYDELTTIAEAVRRLLDAAEDRVDVLVVDDGSPDGTAGLVAALAGREPSVHLVERSSKLGLASAYLLGFDWGRRLGYRVMVQMDADLSHDPADVPRLLDAVSSGADLAIGSRYVAGGGVRNWGPVRRALSRAGNLYARALLRLPVSDLTSGLRAYRSEALVAAGLDGVVSDGYAFQIEMTRRVHRSGGRIVELPIVFTERAAGRSKMSRAIVVEALVRVTRWGAADLARRRR